MIARGLEERVFYRQTASVVEGYHCRTPLRIQQKSNQSLPVVSAQVVSIGLPLVYSLALHLTVSGQFGGLWWLGAWPDGRHRCKGAHRWVCESMRSTSRCHALQAALSSELAGWPFNRSWQHPSQRQLPTAQELSRLLPRVQHCHVG